MRWYCLMFVALVITACGTGEDSAPDISDIDVQLGVRYFEQDLATVAADTGVNGATVLRERFPVFFDSIWLKIMLPGVKQGYDSSLVAAFGRQPLLRRVLDSVTTAYPHTGAEPWRDDLTQAFRYGKHYFPDQPTPQVVTYISEFALGGFTYGDSLVGIGLDFFMGSGFAGYDINVFPRYIQRSMNRDHIAPRAIEAWVSGFLGEDSGQRMLDRMLHNGKLLYIKKKLLPHMPDTAVLGFGESSLTWLVDNEAQLWAHYLDKELLYETKGSLIGKHVGPSPNAPGMPQQAPGGNANWVGMLIIEQYMKRNPQLSLKQLIAQRDAQKLLSESKYKPSR